MSDTPHEPAASASAAPGPAPEADPSALAGEPEAWAAVLAAWEDEAAHRAYLARFHDLEGLATAGGRYRAVLQARPGDPVASRYRDEILKRATVQGLASLPRTQPRQRTGVSRRVILLVALSLGASAIWAAWRLVQALGARPAP